MLPRNQCKTLILTFHIPRAVPSPQTPARTSQSARAEGAVLSGHASPEATLRHSAALKSHCPGSDPSPSAHRLCVCHRCVNHSGLTFPICKLGVRAALWGFNELTHNVYPSAWHRGSLYSIGCCDSSRSLEEGPRFWLHMWQPLERGRCVRAGAVRRGFMEKEGI